MVAVFTCDIISSRFYSVPQRQVLDAGIKEAFAATCFNLPVAEGELLSFSVIQGDEFQFSMLNPAYFYHFLLMLRLRFALLLPDIIPLFRCGIGMGERSISSGSSYQRDGSAYHRSRSALESFDAHKGRLSLLQSPRELADSSANTILGFCDHFEKGWSARQRQALLLKMAGSNLKQSSEIMKSSWQNVQQLLQNAGWERIQEALDYFAALPWSELSEEQSR
ncbi:MAG: hypothetical protein KA984_00225 [Candidatus Cloacimonetes bacterium]|nr:hypothetical protein [Candidatus Cloacimonadota bacterium]